MNDLYSDSRQCVRVEEAVCTWLSFAKDCAAYATLTTNIAASGAQFCSLRNVSVSERLLIDFQFPNKTIGCEARVCWVAPVSNGQVNFGVRFVNLPPPERDFLERFLMQSVAA